MPLHDPFSLPLSVRTSWEAIPGGWPMVIVQTLNGVLPGQYVAQPRVSKDVDDSERQYAVHVNNEANPLAAAIELISPRNKDRHASWMAFEAKCTTLFREGVCRFGRCGDDSTV